MSPEEVLKLFRDSQALLTGHFKLSSGRHSDVYYEKFTLLRNPSVCTRICKELADRLRGLGVVTVIGPTTGGIIIAYEVARYLGIESIYAEAGADGGRVFKRGFTLEKGQKVAIVDDVLTTGRSVREVVELVKRYGSEIVAIGELLDRSGGTVSFDHPFFPLATVTAESWPAESCPLCTNGKPLTQRGSRKF